MFIRPSIIRLIPAAIVGLGWLGTTALAYIRGSKILQKMKDAHEAYKDLSRFRSLCPKCKNGDVVGEIYGSYDQFETGKCETCGWEYDCLTEESPFWKE